MDASKRMRDCSVSILGDSYSTFEGYIPKNHNCYYPSPETVPDVLSVEETWWHMLANRRNLRILINDSYSGSTVCNHVRDGQPPESAFIVRMKDTMSCQGISGEMPEMIFIFGCTNDSVLKRNIGQVQFENWSEEDLGSVLPAYCYLLDYAKNQNPDAIIVTIVNDMLDSQIIEGMICAAEHYHVLCVKLNGIEKSCAHPTKHGMVQICEQIEQMLDMK